MDDAYSYLRLRSLQGRHCTVPSPPENLALFSTSNKTPRWENRPVLEKNESPKLLVWSAADKDGIHRIVDAYRGWFMHLVSNSKFSIEDLAYTLDSHRSLLQWRSFAVLQSSEEIRELDSRISPPIRVHSRVPRIGFVFNGQGGQWFAMGRDLMCYTSFKEDINRAGQYLHTLGCSWSPMGKKEPSISIMIC
jgi:acyl transferase domain-containing protein